MRFGLLGPVEVWQEGRPVAVGRGHERIVLAALLLNANRLTPAGRLIDALWAEASPASAKGQLHNLISRLRARFRAAGDDLIVSHAGGYELRLGAHELDLAEFRRLVARGRAAFDGGHHDLAFSTFTDALVLWRGPALADVPEEFAAQPRQALQEERLAAIEARLLVAMSLGRYDEVLTAVAGLVVEHPHRERLHEIRLTALIATGRRADALVVYRQVRHRFVHDLGVEPSAALRGLEQRALRGEAVAAPSAEPAAPRQLPPLPSVLVGRDELVEEVAAALRAPDTRTGPVVVLTGPGGAGKSTVALAAARAAGDAFPDGQLYVDLGGTRANPSDPHDVAGRFLRSLGVTGAGLPEDRDERIAVLRSHAGKRRLLVVLDDAANEEQVRPLLVGAAGCATVVTARRRLAALVGAARWTVPMLTPDAARRLLGAVTGADRITREPAAAEHIVALCGHLPLAVCVAAARLSVRPEWTLAEFEQRLTEQQGRLDALAVGDLNVRASIAVGYRTLEPAARLLCRRLGLLALPDWPGWVAGALVGGDQATLVGRLLDDLVDAHLLESLGRDALGQPRFRMHALIADFARERAEAEDTERERTEAVSATLRGWLALAEEADEHLNHAMVAAAGLPAQAAAEPRAPAVRAAPADWFETERVNLLTTVEQACRLGPADVAGTLALRLVGFLTLRSYDDDLERMLRAAIPPVRAAGLDRLSLRLLNGLFAAIAQRNRYAELPAIAREELLLARRLDDLPGEVLALSHAGRAARMLGRFAECAELLQQALELCRRHQIAAKLVIRVVGALVVLHIDLGRPERALPLCEEALRIDEAGAGSRLRAIHLRLYGVALTEAGRLADAEHALAMAAAEVEALADDRGSAWIAHAMAELDLRAARWDAAEARLERSLRVHERVGDQEGVAEVLRSRGDLLAGLGRPRDAVVPLRRSLEIWSSLGARLERARTLARLAVVLAAAGSPPAGAEHHDECRRILAELRLDERCLRLPPFLTRAGEER